MISRQNANFPYNKMCATINPMDTSNLQSLLPSCSASLSSEGTSGLGSLHGSSEELSETSDYQRSTPSPRDQDDDLFMVAKNKNKTFRDDFDCEISRDQGFIDTVVKKRRKRKHYEELATPEKADQKPFCFSPKSFYKTCPSEPGRTPLSQHHIDLATELIERKRRELSEKKSTKRLRRKLISKAKLHQKKKKKKKARIVTNSSTQTIFKSQTLSAKKCKVSEVEPTLKPSSEPTEDLLKPPCKKSESQAHPIQSKILRPPVLNVLSSSRGRDEKQESKSDAIFSLNLSPKLSLNNSLLNPNNTLEKNQNYLFGSEGRLERKEKTKPAPPLSPSPPSPVSKSEHIFGSGPSRVEHTEVPKSLLFRSLSKDNEVRTDSQPEEPPVILELKTSRVSSGDTQTTNKLRFPSVLSASNRIMCKWKDCPSSFTSYGGLSDHLKAVHVVAQIKQCKDRMSADDCTNDISYKCMWVGCKVFNMVSSSTTWLEKHVPTHGGKYAFACIVSGCKMRFSSQKNLQRHVNQHFDPSVKNDSFKPENFDPYHRLSMRKKAEQATKSESSKNLRRAGVKLKFRRTAFSARNHDFFDAGTMFKVRDIVQIMETAASEKFGLANGSIKFRANVSAMRTAIGKGKEVLVQWIPTSLLPDEWVQHKDFKPEKVVKFDDLPAEAKRLIDDFKYEAVRFKQEQLSNQRKRKGVAPATASPSSPVKS